MVKKSQSEIDIDIRDLYVHKVKTIYGKILEYATIAQSELELSKEQHKRISEIKIANRKMVEIIRDVKELRRNISVYTYADNEYIQKEYNNFRRMVVRVLRAIYSFRIEDGKDVHYEKLMAMRNKAKQNSRIDNKGINNIIRKNLITTDMASSLVNDHDNVNDMVKKIIEVGELLYSEKDSILEAV